MLLKHTAVIDAWFENGFNKSEAMITAGYSETTANGRANSVFHREDVKAEIKSRQDKARKKHEVTMDWLIERLKQRATSGETLAKFKKIQSDGTLMWDFTEATPKDIALVQDLGVEFYTEGRGKKKIDVKKFRIREPDIQAALMALGRHLGAFTDVTEHVDAGGIAERIQAGRKRAYGPERLKTSLDEEPKSSETKH